MDRRRYVFSGRPQLAKPCMPVAARVLALTLISLAVTVNGVAAQTRTVTGQITSAAAGDPLVGAEILLGSGAVTAAGRTAASTTSGASGAFTLEVPQGEATLVVRMLGFETATVIVAANESTADVALETDPFRLDEIVVTGQATGVQRRNLANAVSTVSADQLNIVPTGSIETQLAGKVPGADIQANSGAPGGGNQVSLRGVSTIFGSAAPLYVVDGVIVSDAAIASGANSITSAGSGMANNQDNVANRIADLNPADIENIEILKGGSAAAIYGSRANNGVILVTTKQGQPGETQFNLSQRFGISRVANKLGTRTYSSAAEAEDPILGLGDQAKSYLSQFNGELPGPFDLEDELAGGSAPASVTQLSMSGGTDRTRFYASGLVHNEDGVIPGSYYDHYTMKLNLDQDIGDRLGLSLRTSGMHSNTGRGLTGNDNAGTTYYVTLTSTPSFINLTRSSEGRFPTNVFAFSNPLETAEFVKNDESLFRFIGSLEATYDLLTSDEHSVRLLGQAGADIFSQNNEIYAPEDVQFECTNEAAGCTPTDNFPGTSVDSDSENRQYNLNLNAVHSFLPSSGLFTATTSAGLQYAYLDQDVLRVQAQDLFPGQQNVDQAVNRVPNVARSRSKDLGLYLQEEVLIKDQLLVTASVRGDRSSNNVQTDKWFYYPKVAGSLRLPLGTGAVDEVKLRAAWGQSGLQPLYGQKFNNLNPGSIGGLQTLVLGTTTAASDLRPERQTELEGGIDVSLFGGRANVELTGYRQRVDDLLLTRGLAASTGFNNAVFNNDGWMTNRGIEAAVNALPVQTNDFSWSSGITFSLDRSKMDSLSVPAFSAPAAGFGTSLGAGFIQQGKSLTQIYGRDTVAVADDSRCLESLGVESGSGSCEPGTVFLTQLGDANPDFRMGFSNIFRWRSLSLATTVDWQQGGTVNNLLGWLFDLNHNSPDYAAPCNLEGCGEVELEDGSTRPETLGEYRLRVYPAKTSTVFLEDATYVKLREVALTWQIPQSLLQTSFLSAISGAQVTLSGRNLIRITDYRGLDPEVHNFGTTAIRTNIDVGPYPPTRSFWLSLDLAF